MFHFSALIVFGPIHSSMLEILCFLQGLPWSKLVAPEQLRCFCSYQTSSHSCCWQQITKLSRVSQFHWYLDKLTSACFTDKVAAFGLGAVPVFSFWYWLMFIDFVHTVNRRPLSYLFFLKSILVFHHCCPLLCGLLGCLLVWRNVHKVR